MSNTKRVTAIFENKSSAKHAINQLELDGVKQENISLLVSSNSWEEGDDIKIEENSKAPEGASIGAGAGALLGAVTAGLTTTGTVVLTGGAGLLAAGPLVAALAGAGAGGASGGVIGGLIGLGIPEVEAKYVDEELGRGHVLLGVDAPKDKADHIEEMLNNLAPRKVSVN